MGYAGGAFQCYVLFCFVALFAEVFCCEFVEGGSSNVHFTLFFL